MGQRTVAPDRKLVRLAGTVPRHENMRMVLSRNFEHMTYLIGDFARRYDFRAGKFNGALPIPNAGSWTRHAKSFDRGLSVAPAHGAGRDCGALCWTHRPQFTLSH